jgi:hypothetical protein
MCDPPPWRLLWQVGFYFQPARPPSRAFRARDAREKNLRQIGKVNQRGLTTSSVGANAGGPRRMSVLGFRDGWFDGRDYGRDYDDYI